jgi:hypothetical protein
MYLISKCLNFSKRAKILIIIINLSNEKSINKDVFTLDV